MKKQDVYNNSRNEIINLYDLGKTLSEISSMINIPITGVFRVLKKNNIKGKKMFFYRKKMRKYSIDENYFNNIDIPEKSYILGLLYADGNANKKYKQITLKLQERDVEILEKISTLIGTNKPLHFCKKTKPTHQNQYALKITNKIIYNDLIKYGIVPNKTFITKLPILNEELIPHFVRGYFDGDGCIYQSKNGKVGCIDIIASAQLCNDMQKIFSSLEVKSIISHDKRCKHGVDRLRIRRYKDIVKICNWMYADSNIHLKRKFDKFIKLMEAHNDKF
jgi:intein-encoded DNA endonuclease-like protein